VHRLLLIIAVSLFLVGCHHHSDGGKGQGREDMTLAA
jgi:hypothetical protein